MTKIAVIGLGYVGLPLAHAFAKAGHKVTGYDISQSRIDELRTGTDRTNELTEEQLKETDMFVTTDSTRIVDAEVFIMAIPTPVDGKNRPDMTMLEEASKTVGKRMQRGAIVVYESTVYPGVTEDICGRILEETSGLQCGTDFTLGYSPERINPGDKEHGVSTIVKIVAGQDEKTTDTLVALYGSIVKAGIHRAPSIKVAEMAKAIENAQRDLNIAFINEVAVLCGKLGIKTNDVLSAAGTKWNFLNFKPGLVGGHCIGVDPYYLMEMAKKLGVKSKVIGAGREMNDSMAAYVATQVVAALPMKPKQARILLLGLTFKENIPDLRNSKSFDVMKQLQKAGCNVEVDDPWRTYEDLKTMGLPAGHWSEGPFDAVLVLVPHREYLETGVQTYVDALKPGGLFYDLKSAFDPQEFAEKGLKYRAL